VRLTVIEGGPHAIPWTQDRFPYLGPPHP